MFGASKYTTKDKKYEDEHRNFNLGRGTYFGIVLRQYIIAADITFVFILAIPAIDKLNDGHFCRRYRKDLKNIFMSL